VFVVEKERECVRACAFVFVLEKEGNVREEERACESGECSCMCLRKRELVFLIEKVSERGGKGVCYWQ